MKMPTKAYNIEMLTQQVAEDSDRGHGWCFGLPPGIAPEQWPLDPQNGYPLMHGFTILLPEDYRCHGPEIVGLSFFSTSPDFNDGGPTVNKALKAALDGAADPSDKDLQPFRDAERNAHPRLHRMKDTLDCSYAVILLTRQEFEGQFCRPPVFGGNSYLKQVPAPIWMQKGSALLYWEMNYSPSLSLPAEEYHVYKALGQIPDRGLAFNRAIRWTPRARDPNAGIAPVEAYGADPGPGGYLPYFFWKDGVVNTENYREHEWAADHTANHIGGTMRPIQWIPSGFSPFYIGFDEDLGGYNFGGDGNAQLDFLKMKFDWACG